MTEDVTPDAASWPREHSASTPLSSPVCVVFEVLVACVLAAMAAPWVLLYRRDMVPTLYLEATLTPLTRRGRYAPLLHITLLVALLVHLRGFTDVTAVFGTAMFCVYVDCGVRKHEPHPRLMQLMAMYCVLSVIQVVIALLANNETIRVVNTCSVALLAMHFTLAK